MKNNKYFSFILFLMCICILMLSACDQTNDSTKNTSKGDTTVNNAKNNQNTDTFILPDSPLQKWDAGKNIENLQDVLNELSYTFDSTGIFDEYTTWAITDIQLQADNIHPTGVFDEDTKEFIQLALNEEVSVTPEKGLPLPSEAYLLNVDSETVENPFDILALINKEHKLPGDYIPDDLVVPNVRYPFTEDLPKKQLRAIAANALENLFKASDKANLDLYAQSGYRSFNRQEAIFASNVEQHGKQEANNFSAQPGQSEHQSGLTMDVTTPSVGFDLVTEFGETAEGIWLRKNAHKHGFIIRYLEGREHITQYQYEPWHLRYVGEKVATEMYEQDLTFEEYINQR